MKILICVATYNCRNDSHMSLVKTSRYSRMSRILHLSMKSSIKQHENNLHYGTYGLQNLSNNCQIFGFRRLSQSINAGKCKH